MEGRLILVYAVLAFVDRVFSLDATLDASATGQDVVDACIDKIQNLGVFTNDFSFLKRIALVESNYGSGTIDASQGLWHISAHISEQLQVVTNQDVLQQYISVATASFGSQITAFDNDVYSVPLRSALAARMFIQLVEGPINLPASVEAQAVWWSTYYNTLGNATHFENLAEANENTAIFSAKPLDIWFLLDGSASIGLPNFQTSVEFVKNVTSRFTLGANDARVGFSVFSFDHVAVSNFSTFHSQSEFSSLLNSVAYPQDNTLLGEAVYQIVSTSFIESGGARSLSIGVPRILLVLTDGLSRDDTSNATDLAREQGITILGVGIGNGIDEVALFDLVEPPSTAHAFLLKDFDQPLGELQTSVMDEIRKVPAQIPVGSEISATVLPGDTAFYALQVPKNVSVKFDVNVTEASHSGRLFVSSTTHNPNAANYQYLLHITQGLSSITINTEDLQVQTQSARKRRYLQSDSFVVLYLTVKCDSTLGLRFVMTSTML